MDQVITFDKSLKERLMEYVEILGGNNTLSVLQIKKEWSFFLELSMDPIGWQAVWKIPRLTCEDLEITFPKYVLVYVEYIYPTTFTALVKILAVQDDISIAEKHYVPLVQLWPTKEQDPTIAINLKTTANSIDMLRFFYQNIFMPWDYEEDENVDWLGKHLESRLRLYYDMRNGVIPPATSAHLSALLSDARRLRALRERIEKELEDEDEEDENLDLDSLNEIKDSRLQNLMELHVKIIQIGDEVKLLENPLTRIVIIKNQQQTRLETKNSPPKTWLITNKGKLTDSIQFLNDVKSSYEEGLISNNLAEALEKLFLVKANDIVVLCKGEHFLKTVGCLETGGTIRSVYSPDETLLVSKNENIMMDFSGGNILIENITIDASSAQCGLLVRCGKVTVRNCKMIGDNGSSTHQGIIVLSGGELVMEDCEITRFWTAVVGNTGSKITLTNCEIFNVHIGVKMYDGCSFNAVSSNFYNCEEYGLCIETESCLESGEQRVGNFDVLNIVPGVTLQGINGQNNFKGNVMISQKPKIEPLRDLFSTPADKEMLPDTTISEDTDMSSEDINATIIENRGPAEEDPLVA